MADQEAERERQVRSIVAAIVAPSELSDTLLAFRKRFQRAAESFAADLAALRASIGLVTPHSDTGVPRHGG